mgnify:CR=1 FL=1
MMSEEETETAPEKLALDAWHRAHGARMVPFAGYEMPIQYEGIVVEHNWTRQQAGRVRKASFDLQRRLLRYWLLRWRAG